MSPPSALVSPLAPPSAGVVEPSPTISGAAEQTALAQSLPLLQLLPDPHPAHPGPPQSVSVSVPLRRPSAQLAA
jgi:hypothetical protein